ncbi:MAG: LytR/AlgR family response regulator transcription factor [Bacteroidia bacterium]
MKYKVVILEDEIPAREILKDYIKRYFNNVTVLAEIDNIRESIQYLDNHEVDILFVDVNLKDGKSIDILNKIDTTKYKIIFTTAFEGYALDAFRFKSFGYLLKPLDPIDFKEIMNRVIIDLKNESQNSDKRIKIQIASGSRWLHLYEIVRCEAEGNYAILHLKDKSRVVVSKTLKYVESNIINSSNFIRVHQSHLINKSFIKSEIIQNNLIELTNGDLVPVSRSKRNSLFR